MALPVLKEGMTHYMVPRVRAKLVPWLRRQGRRTLAAQIDGTNPRFGAHLERAVQLYQSKRGLPADGIIGPKTWKALGFVKPSPYAGMVLRGIPWQPGVMPVDGNWVVVQAARKLLDLRRRGIWTGKVNSGWRPDWYQKILFDAAVRKYGSYAAASKWVAPPGRSNHRFRDGRGATDMDNAWQVLRARVGFYQPMSWESWHLQLAAYWGRAMAMIPSFVPVLGSIVPSEPDEDVVDPETGVPYGLARADVDESVEELLALMEERHEMGDGSDDEL